MKRCAIHLGLAVSVAVALAAGCGAGKARTDSTAPGAGSQDAPELAVLDRFAALDDDVEKSRSQCPRLAASIDRWLETNRESVSALLEESRARPRLAGSQLEEVEQHLERIFDRLLDAVAGCTGKGGVDQAYARLDAFLEAGG